MQLLQVKDISPVKRPVHHYCEKLLVLKMSKLGFRQGDEDLE